MAKLQDELQAVKGQLAEAKQDVQVQTHLRDQAEKQYLAERLVKADKAYNRFRREHKARLNAV